MKPPVITLLFIVASAGCADRGGPALVRTTEIIDNASIETCLKRDPSGAEEPQRVTPLLSSESFSADLLQLRMQQPRHVHRLHDVSICVYRGSGELYIDDRRRRVSPGQFFHVPRGVPHWCVNTGDGLLVLVRIFTPPLDQPDTIEFPREAASYPRPMDR